MQLSFILLTGESSGDKIRIQIGQIGSYCKLANATLIFTIASGPIIVRESCEEIDRLLIKADAYIHAI